MEPTNETNAIISDTETAREKFEQGRLSRRAALRKMGITTGMAFFGMFAVDDLARMAIKQMEQHKETRQVAETVAKEFKNSGIAFAGPSGSSGAPDPDCKGCCSKSDATLCQKCCDDATAPNSDGGSPRGKCYTACDTALA